MNHSDDPIISAGPLSAAISAAGAELQRFTHTGRGELLWDGNPAVWKGRAPLLFPIVGALQNNRYRYAGREYELARHGFARNMTWTLIDHAAQSATFRLSATDATRAVYPFEFELDVTYTLDDRSLSVSAMLTNLGDAAMPASFGFHPAFRRPLPSGGDGADYVIVFDQPEPEPIRRLNDAGVLLSECIPTPVDENRLVLHEGLFAHDALIFDALRSRAVEYGTPSAPGLRIEFDEMPQLGIWSKPGAGFCCIEPWAGYADPEGFNGDIFTKPGIITLAPGLRRQFAMRVSVLQHAD